jgi:hypothetical protein
MDFDYINVNQICSLKGYIASKETSYKYRKSSKTLFGRIRPEGFYLHDEYFQTINQIESDELYCKGQEVFYKPYIVVKMSNGDTHKKFFHTKDEMFEFMCNSPLSTIKWINRKEIIESRAVLMEKYRGYPDEYRILSKNVLETR